MKLDKALKVAKKIMKKNPDYILCGSTVLAMLNGLTREITELGKVLNDEV